MKSNYLKSSWLSAFGLLLALPAAIFIIFSILKYGIGISAPYDSVAPFLENWGGNEPPGWNINLLIVAGPVLAIVITFLQVLKIEWDSSKEDVQLHFSIRKKWFPIWVAFSSAALLLVLFFYLFTENCNC
jgi:hypothetical protein